jgi:hypothetical protein
MAELLFQYPHKWVDLLPLIRTNPELAEHLIQENDRALEDYLGGLVLVGSTSTLLSESVYNPASQATIFCASEATGKPVDGTNLKVTFTPPASGTVYISLSAGGFGLTGDSLIQWMILDSNQSVGAGATILGSAIWIAEATGINRYTSRHKITGLTPGTPITVYWGHAMNYSDATPAAGTAYGGTVGPAVMTVKTE